LARAGFDVGDGSMEALSAAWLEVYRDADRWFELYELAEKLVDIDDALAMWRHKHVLTVERIIGSKRGTGGSAGASYLRSTLDRRVFPELWDLRTGL
jgi:tryptophan 2,3-dioxygenase